MLQGGRIALVETGIAPHTVQSLCVLNEMLARAHAGVAGAREVCKAAVDQTGLNVLVRFCLQRFSEAELISRLFIWTARCRLLSIKKRETYQVPANMKHDDFAVIVSHNSTIESSVHCRGPRKVVNQIVVHVSRAHRISVAESRFCEGLSSCKRAALDCGAATSAHHLTVELASPYGPVDDSRWRK